MQRGMDLTASSKKVLAVLNSISSARFSAVVKVSSQAVFLLDIGAVDQYD